MLEQAQRVLKDIFGYDSSVAARRDHRARQRRRRPGADAHRRRQVAVLPGPALLRDGLAVVVSPLIA
jgi:ATP-dependent DNA helicase RecQ